MLADVLSALELQLGTACAFRDGPEHLVERAAPSIVAVPMDETIVQPDVYWTTSEVALAQRNATVQFHVLGATRSAAEELVSSLIAALRAVAGRAYNIGVGSWTDQNAAALTARGRLYVLNVVFLLPVMAPATTEAVIGATDTQDVALEET
jgi:hypothetical protein